MNHHLLHQHRRDFLRFLATSPLFASVFAETLSESAHAQGTPPGDPKFPIPAAKDALSLSDFEALARQIALGHVDEVVVQGQAAGGDDLERLRAHETPE